MPRSSATDGRLATASNAAHDAQARHSAEAWAAPMAAFFVEVVAGYRNRLECAGAA